MFIDVVGTLGLRQPLATGLKLCERYSMLYFKEDWEEKRNWLTGWWHREVRDHWALGVSAPRTTPLKQAADAPRTDDWRKDWTDPDTVLARAEARSAQTWFGGMAFPYVSAGLGPGALGVYLGCEPVFAADTVWYKPVFNDPAKVDLQWNPDHPWWQWTLQTTRLFRQRCRGRKLVAIPDLVEGLDVLAQLFDPQQLLIFLLDCPDEIHRLLDQVTDIYFKAFDALYDEVKDDTDGNAFIAFNAWGPGRTLKTQCDFSAMISPEMFAEFVCPYMEKQCARVDYSVYHLDGSCCRQHLQHLVGVPSLNAIQWTPGAANPPPSDRCWWESIWKPVYEAGKSAMCIGAPPNDVEPFVRHFGARGTFVMTHLPSEEQGRRFLDASGEWGQ